MSDHPRQGDAGGNGQGASLVDVHVLGLPLDVRAAADRHLQALEREFELIRRRDDDADILPHRLRRLVDELTGRFAGIGEGPRQALAAAADRGDAEVDLHYRVPRTAGAAARRLGELLDEADAYCAAGDQLLTLVTPPDVRRFRHWFLGEFERQTAGAAPTRWTDHEPRPDDVPPAPAPVPVASAAREAVRAAGALPEGWAVATDAQGGARVTVAGPLDLVSAPALRDILIDVVADASRVAVDLTGCDFLDSVGLSVLLAAMARAQEQGATVTFRLSAAADRVLAVSGVLERLQVEA